MSSQQSKVQLFSDPLFQNHRTGEHPESPARLASIEKNLQERNLYSKTVPGKISPVSREHLKLVHDPAHIEQIEKHSQAGGGRIEADTVMSAESFEVALNATGVAINAVEEVLEQRANSALCLVRPPGHHALPEHPMGFCLFNNIAVAAKYAIQVKGLNRVLIVDWDVHHGNGTQYSFYEEEQVHFFSSHRWPYYPGTGGKEETGTGKGLGTILNLPVDVRTPKADFLKAFASHLEQAAQKAKPELVLISAGFDAHHLDPIGGLGLETEDFAHLTQMVCDIAQQYCEGRIVSLLEGGYHLQALADSVEVHLQTLLNQS